MSTHRRRLTAGQMQNSVSRPIYPFTAIVGQDEMKLALTLNVIDPAIGGVLIMGHRGTGKSTAVRALADLLPEMWVVRGCSYRCDATDRHNLCVECQQRLAKREKLAREKQRVPVVDLPLGATEDRVCGTIDIERALKDGVKSFEPGLLARANRGFLYVDEVNLLEDHLVDLLLDVSVTGRSRVERENISIEHPARFVLIGSGNPEEGELRPQLLDRFGLQVEVRTENKVERRIEIVERHEEFARNPERFIAGYTQQQEEMGSRISRAQKKALAVKLERRLLRQIAELCSELKVDGHRGELTITRSARALASYEGRRQVTEQDVRRVAAMSLRHRLRRDPLSETASSTRIDQALEEVFQGGRRGGSRGSNDSGSDWPSERDNGDSVPDYGSHLEDSIASRKKIGANALETAIPPTLETRLPEFPLGNGRRRVRIKPSGKTRFSTRSRIADVHRGRYSRAVARRTFDSRVAFDATLRALAIGVGLAQKQSGVKKNICPSKPFPMGALRFKEFTRRSGALFILAIDASGSMALNRIHRAKAAAVALLRQSYLRRDSVAIITFRGTAAELVLPPSRSILRARRALDSLSVGGATPLTAGLACSVSLANRQNLRAGEVFLLLFTDGQANVSFAGKRTSRQHLEDEVRMMGAELLKARVSTIVVGTQNPYLSKTSAARLAEVLNARFVELSQLDRLTVHKT